MGSQLFEVLRQGVWASLTGGWFHDPRQPTLTNTIHLYLWLILLAFPLTLCVYFTSNVITWTAYTGSIGALFAIIKLLNWRFHYLFDTTEAIEETPKEDEITPSDKPDLTFEAKLKRDRPKNLGLAEADEIELQVLDSRSKGRMTQTQCLLEIEDISPPVVAGASGIGGDFKVDVHRKESSSSSPNSCHSVTNDSWKIQSQQTSRTDSVNRRKDSADTTVMIENTQQKDDFEELSISSSLPIPMDDNTSPTSQEPSISSADVVEFPRGGKRFPNPQAELPKTANASNNLKGTTSLELGFVLSHKEPQVSTVGTTQEFRRTQSAQETSTTENRRDTLLRSRLTSNTSNFGRPCNKRLDGLVAISLQSLPSEKVVCLKRSKSEEVKLKPFEAEACGESENEEEDEVDEGLRCRTPLLYRSGDSVSRKEDAGTRELPKPVQGGKKSRLSKKVSFTTRSSSESETEPRIPSSSARVHHGIEIPEGGDEALSQSTTGQQRANCGEKKFALVPSQDSLVGWNQSGGPFTSQWLFQAVNPMPHRDAAATSTQNLDAASRDEKGETESVKSEDSDGTNSFSGISKLFEIEDEENSLKDLSAEKPHKIKPVKVHTRPPPKKPPRNVHPGKVMGITPRMLLSGDDDVRRRQLLRRPRAAETETSGSGGWRQERETSPRILERLLEENQEHGPQLHGLQLRTAGPSATFRDMNQEDTHKWTELEMVDIGGHGHGPYIWPEGETEGATSGSFRHPPSRLQRPRERESRSSSDGHVSNPFLQSAREIKNHLRSLSGTQNSLDISGIVDRQGHGGGSSRTNNQLEGLFRARDEIQQPDQSNPASVNRHRRLRRLAQSRRTLERRREIPSSVLYKPGSTHLANSHDDTTEGALHYFQDENGDWFSYTFSEKGVGCVVHAEPPPPPSPRTPCLSTILNRIDLGASAYLEAKAGPSSAPAPPVASTSRQSTIMNTPPSSESWSSVSSSELAVDPTNHKLYSSYHRRGNEHVSHRPQLSSSPIDTLNFHYEPGASGALAVAQNGRTSIPLPGGIARPWQRNPRDVLSVLTESFLERRRLPSGPYATTGERMGSNVYPLSSDPNNSKKNAKYFYWMNPLPFVSSLKLKVTFDRLNLMAIFDRSRSFFENLLAILLAIGVASLGSFMLHTGYFQDLTMVLLCFVIASCQFSLLKSVQPDAASPTHGFNRIVAFSRPIYFCLCGCLVFLIQNCLDHEATDYGWNIYGIDVTNRGILTGIRDFILIVILAFPVLFCVGIFPQVNTFSIFLLEQMDIHCFGGNAAASLFAVAISNLKNWLAVGCLYGFVYGALAENEGTQHLLFSIFCALLVPMSYHMSRCSSDATIMWGLLRQHLCPDEDCFGESTAASAKQKEAEDHGDPLPKKLRITVNARLKSDSITCPVLGILIFALHSSTVFTALQPGLLPVLWIVAIGIGFLLHYVMPQLRKQMPCLLVAHPVLLPAEYKQFETREAAKMMWFEKFYIVACFLERNILYPLLFVSALTQEAAAVVREDRFGLAFGSLVVTVTALKALRTSYSDPSKHYLILTFTILFFKFDWEGSSETFIVDLFFMSILFHKIYELWLKLQFVTSYISPWQISWGSAFHAFAQPFSVPHSAMLFLQAFISSIFSAPLNPFLGSAIFITSYVRPIKFWERDYNTKRVDHSNTRLAAHLEKNPGADDNNLNSIFYEHLTRSLQASLCGDVLLGRWGLVAQGDCFVLCSDYLNCLVHVIEIGNGLLTFQMRGLEFRGTYCQQREVEAISEGVEEDDGCCCCEPGHLPHMLSANAAFSQRWLAWEVTVSKYVLEGYSIADNSAVSMLQVYDLRKILITYYIKGVIYYTMKAEKMPEWLESEAIKAAMRPTLEKSYAELDPIFNVNIDEDYDFTISGITRNSFCNVYHSWIQHCIAKRETGSTIPCGRDSTIVSLCFALSILARRALGIAAHSNSLSSVEFFLFGLHALFKGDFRITSQRDEWVFNDMDLLKKVVSPAVRMSLKLHQDHFMCPDEYDDNSALFDAISYHDEHLVISHEGDPAWRSAVLAGREGLLALRHVFDDGADEYKIIMLNKRHLSFRVIKLNRECVRGLWAGQQQELVYLRNRDPERGSIQNAKQALRNIINSSCDQPIGYPIYVSPLTTSYAESHSQLTSLVGGPISLSKIKESIIDLWQRVRYRCVQGCSSGSSLPQEEGGGEVYGGQEGSYVLAPSNSLPLGGMSVSASQSLEGSQIGASSLGRGSVSRNLSRGSGTSNVSFGKPSTSTLTSLAGFLTDANGNSRSDKERGGGGENLKWASLQKVRIVDANQVYDGLNMGRRIDVVWPDEAMRTRGGRNYWQNWVPEDGMEGIIVHKWIPGHRDAKSRSITDKTILLLKMEDKFVPIAESGVERIVDTAVAEA